MYQVQQREKEHLNLPEGVKFNVKGNVAFELRVLKCKMLVRLPRVEDPRQYIQSMKV